MNIFRKRLMEFISQNPGLNSRELSVALDRSPADIRYHLALMVQQGYLHRTPALQRVRGHPLFTYSVSKKDLPDNLPLLCSILLNQLSFPLGLRNTARLLSLPSAPTPGNTLLTMNRLVAHLNQMNYAATWEAYRSGPRIMLHNCPYAVLVKQHPQLCEMDRNLLEFSLHMPVTQVTTLASGANSCIFNISSTSSK